MDVSYTVPNKEVFTLTDFGIQGSFTQGTITIPGELRFHHHNNRRTTLFYSHLLPGSPSIFMMARAAAWLATEHNFIVQFEFNDRTYHSYPFQTYEELLQSYFYTLYSATQEQMAERITRLEEELKDCREDAEKEVY